MADDAVPGPDGADWQAKDRKTFETSLAKFGEKLVSGIKAKSRPGPDYGNP
jgi:Fungal chitosanase of glycosyl hydrolase group 75